MSNIFMIFYLFDRK